MSERRRNTIIRFTCILLGITLGFIAVIVQIIRIQTTQRSKWEKIEATQERSDVTIEPNRGNIKDCNGRLLASSMPQYMVYMDTRVEALHLGGDTLFYNNVDSLAAGLSRIVGDLTPQEYRHRMVTAFRHPNKKKRDFRVCPGRVNYIQKREIEKLPFVKRGIYKSGFHYDTRHVRNKPYGSLASRTIGTLQASEGRGNTGLERQYEEYLHGKPGVAHSAKKAGKRVHIPIKEAEDGCDIITTLDADLLDICDHALRQRLDYTQADWGCVILMEVKSGAIKAICNLDRDTTSGRYYEAANHAVIRVEPGSTFKTISLVAAIDDGKAKITDTIAVSRAPWQYYNIKHTDAHPKDTAYTLQSALAVSSNIAFAKLITRSYEGKAERFVKKLNNMGITSGFEVEIPGASAPKIMVPKDAVTLSKMAYGYSVELSPIQILAFYNAIANQGKMIRPMLVQRIEKDGEVIKTMKTETIKEHLCNNTTLEGVQSALSDVVWDNHLGTASVNPWGIRKAQSNLVHIAGKTGTAQLLEKGRYWSNKHRITFVGYFPKEAPEYTCICMIQRPRRYGYDAGMDCGTVVKQIAEFTMAYSGVYTYENEQLVWHKNK